MPIGKLNVGKGLLRLYLELWLLLAMASLVGGHREVMTYFGSTYWSAESVAQRKKEGCKSEECWKPPITDLVESDNEKSVKERVELGAFSVLVVPGIAGARACSPSCVRMRLITGAFKMAAMILRVEKVLFDKTAM